MHACSITPSTWLDSCSYPTVTPPSRDHTINIGGSPDPQAMPGYQHTRPAVAMSAIKSKTLRLGRPHSALPKPTCCTFAHHGSFTSTDTRRTIMGR